MSCQNKECADRFGSKRDAHLLFGEPSVLLVLVLGFGQEQLGNGQGDPRDHLGLAEPQPSQGLGDLLLGKSPRLVGLASLCFRFLAGLLGLGDLGDSDVELLVEPEGEGLVIVGDLVVDDLVAAIVDGEVQVSMMLVWITTVWKDGDGRGRDGSRSMLTSDDDVDV
jgi:hypothetical protein